MSIIFMIDGSYELSVEALGETCNIDFYGAIRQAIYCEGGIPKKLNVEMGKWRDGIKTLENQKKKEEKKRVVLTGGREVEIVVREKREGRGKRKNMEDDPEPVITKKRTNKKKPEITSPTDDLDVPQVKDEDTVDNTLMLDDEVSRKVGASRKERREREVRESTPALFGDDQEEEEEGEGNELTGPPLSAAEAHSKVHTRIDLLENQADEIADTLERQHTLVRSMADSTPVILSNSIKAAEGTSTITKMLPPPHPDFTYRYLRKKSVDWMTIMESSWHSQRPWTRQSSLSIRGDSLRDRDQDRVRWMIECVMYRRRLGIGSGRKAHISDMRKRLNTYAGKERDSYKKGIGHIDEEEEEDHPREMDMDEEEKERGNSNEVDSQLNGLGVEGLSEEEEETDMTHETERQMGPVIKREGSKTYFQLQ